LTTHSLLPPLAILLSFGSAAIVYFIGRRAPRASGPLALIATGLNFAVCVTIAAIVFGGRESHLALVAAQGSFLELRVDGLSAFMLMIIGLLGFLSALYSLQAIPTMVKRGHGSAERVPMYYSLLVLFVGTMVWACTTNNIIVLWLAVETTTLSSAFLVAFAWDKGAVEAAYKYLLLLTVGITFALLGCVLLYSTAASQEVNLAGINPMAITDIAHNAGVLMAASPNTIILGTILLLVGFGTKAGLAPMHAWLPDAHSEAPAPVSVLLSGVVIKVGAYALIRCVLPFMVFVPGLSVAMALLACVGMLWGIAACAVQDDLKRLLAYSSFSQIGYVLLGLAIGTPLGIFGALFHMLNHALAKGLLFFAAGSVEHGARGRSLTRLSGLRAQMPITSAVFFVGALALGGMPGLNGFLSKVTIFIAAADAGMWVALVAGVITGLLTLVVLVRTAINLFLGRPGQKEFAHAHEAPVLMWAPTVVLALLCLAIGLYPPIADALVRPAADAVMSTLGTGGVVPTLLTQGP